MLKFQIRQAILDQANKMITDGDLKVSDAAGILEALGKDLLNRDYKEEHSVSCFMALAVLYDAGIFEDEVSKRIQEILEADWEALKKESENEAQ